MTKAGLTATAAAVLAISFASAGLARATPPLLTGKEQIALGKAIAQRNCGMCHSVGSTGFSPNPKAPPFRILHERLDIDRLNAPLAEGIITGHPAMPEFRFESREVEAILQYLKSVQSKAHA